MERTMAYKKPILTNENFYILTTFLTFAVGLFSYMDMLQKRDELQTNKNNIIQNSSPITNKWDEIYVNGNDTTKIQHIDTVAWVIPDSLMFKHK